MQKIGLGAMMRELICCFRTGKLCCALREVVQSVVVVVVLFLFYSSSF